MVKISNGRLYHIQLGGNMTVGNWETYRLVTKANNDLSEILCILNEGLTLACVIIRVLPEWH